jgi:hypothetical protein
MRDRAGGLVAGDLNLAPRPDDPTACGLEAPGFRSSQSYRILDVRNPVYVGNDGRLFRFSGTFSGSNQLLHSD